MKTRDASHLAPHPSPDKAPAVGRRPGRRPGNDSFLYTRVAEALRQDIKTGKYLPGARLPGNEILAKNWDVNRLTVRRALAELISEGLLIAEASRGTFVANKTSLTSDVNVLQNVCLISEVMMPTQPGIYHLEFLDAIRRELAEVACNLILPTHHAPENQSWPDNAGILVLGQSDEQTLRQLARAWAVVMLDANPGNLAIDAVEVDNVAVGRIAAEYLIRDCRAQRVAVIAGEERLDAVRDRWTGFQEIWRKSGLSPSDLQMIPGHFQKTIASELTRNLLSKNPTIEALFCMNDDMAAGALQTLNTAGRLDISLIGCDDVSFAPMLHPTLTTIRIPREAMTRFAVERLRIRMQNSAGDIPAVRHLFQPVLVIRES